MTRGAMGGTTGGATGGTGATGATAELRAVRDRRRTAPERSDHAPLFRLPRTAVITIGLLALAQAVALVAAILLTRRMVEALVPFDVGAAADAAYSAALQDGAVLIALAIALGVMRSLEFGVAEKAGYEVVRVLRMAMYGHLTTMAPAQLRHRARGGLLLRLTGDLSMLRMWLSRGLLQGAVALTVLLAAIGTLLWLDRWIGLAVVSVLSLTAAASVSNGKAMRRATRTMRRRRSLVIGNIDEQINALAVVQTAGRVPGEYARLSRQNDSLTRALCQVAELRGRLRGIATFGAHAAVAAALIVGLAEVRRGATDAATVLTCALICRLVGRPVRTLGLANDYWHRGQVSRGKVVDFLNSSCRPDATDAPALRVPRGAIDFGDVTVPGALASFTAQAPAGSIIAITGPTGSGKTSVLALVSRTIEPSAGTVRIDGQDLSEVSWRSIGRHVGIASPDLPLLRGTVRRNVSYRAAAVSDTELQRVGYALGLDHSLRRHGRAGLAPG